MRMVNGNSLSAKSLGKLSDFKLKPANGEPTVPADLGVGDDLSEISGCDSELEEDEADDEDDDDA